MNHERESPRKLVGPEPIFGAIANLSARVTAVRKKREGVTHRLTRTPRDPRPGEKITLYLSVGPAHHASRAFVYWTTDGSSPVGAHGSSERSRVTPMVPASVEWDTLSWGYLQTFAATLPGQPEDTIVRYRLVAEGPDGQVAADGGASYALLIDNHAPPAWARDAVIYQVFVDRFFPGGGSSWREPDEPTGLYGGTLRGAMEKLDYLSGLGINTILLSPVFPSPSYHGYDATDYFSIEPRLGTKDDLVGLLAGAHRRGIRLLFDFVPNHWSALHPTFQAALRDPESPYVNWYDFRRWPHEYDTFFGARSLPKLDLRNPAARQHLLDAAAYWLELGVDGYRIDYAVGPTPDFWADFRRVTREVRPDCWSFGEVVESPETQVGFEGLLDGCLDFALCEALRRTFATSSWDALDLAAFLDRHEAYFSPDFMRPSFLDNHDMNRFLWVAGQEPARLKIAALCQFTLSGPPIIYYGTEVGLSQQQDVFQAGRALHAEARHPMLWGSAQDADLLNFYAALVDLRRREEVLRVGARRWLVDRPDVVAYSRASAHRTLVVVINLSLDPRSVRLHVRLAHPLLATDAGCRLRSVRDGTQVELVPLSGLVLSGDRS